jgi:hypothetical protein
MGTGHDIAQYSSRPRRPGGRFLVGWCLFCIGQNCTGACFRIVFRIFTSSSRSTNYCTSVNHVIYAYVVKVLMFMVVLPFVWLWPIFSSLILYTVGRTPWTGDQPVARPLPIHKTTETQNEHERDSIPRSQCMSERRQFMPQTALPLWSAVSLKKKLKIDHELRFKNLFYLQMLLRHGKFSLVSNNTPAQRAQTSQSNAVKFGQTSFTLNSVEPF